MDWIIMGSSGQITRFCHSCKRLVILVAKIKAIEASISFLLTKEAAKGSVSTWAAVISFVVESATVIFKGLLSLNFIDHVTLAILILCIDFFSFDVKLAQLMHIINHLMAHFDSFSSLIKSIFVSVNLRQNSTILQLELTDDENFSHSIWNTFFLQIDQTNG